MTLKLELPAETEKKLHDRARQIGESVEQVAVRLIEDALHSNGLTAPNEARSTFDEILEPIRAGWRKSEMSDDQIDELFQDTLKQIRDGKSKGQAP